MAGKPEERWAPPEPAPGAEPSPQTLRSYMSRLRAALGAEHLPEQAAAAATSWALAASQSLTSSPSRPGAGGGVDAPGRLVAVDGFDHVARSQLGQGVLLPGLLLAAVVGELAGAQLPGQGGEGAPGGYLAELSGIADQDQLRPGCLGELGQAVKVAGADHAGLVHHHHAVGSQCGLRALQVDEQAGKADRCDARPRLQLGCCSGCQ